MAWLLLFTIPPAVIALIYFLPVCLKADYDESDLLVNLYVGPIKFQLYPSVGEDKRVLEWVERTDTKNKKGNGEQRAGGRYEKLIAYVRFAADLLNDIRKKIVIKQFYMKITQAADDPYELAMKYGATCAVAANLLALVEEVFTVRNKEIIVCSDFLAEQTLFVAKFNITISLGRFVRLYSTFSKRYYNEFNRILIMKKGGANK